MYTSIFIEAVQNVTCELKMQSVLKLTYLFMNFVTHAFVFQYSVILNFVFQPVFERACLQLCSLILFVRSAYMQGYDFI